LEQVAVLRVALNRELKCAAPKICWGERREPSDDIEIDRTDLLADLNERNGRRVDNKWEGGGGFCAARGEEWRVDPPKDLT
jgi:hypothetical protein